VEDIVEDQEEEQGLRQAYTDYLQDPPLQDNDRAIRILQDVRHHSTLIFPPSPRSPHLHVRLPDLSLFSLHMRLPKSDMDILPNPPHNITFQREGEGLIQHYIPQYLYHRCPHCRFNLPKHHPFNPDHCPHTFVPRN
jgi:hypothetical protein